MLPSAWLRTPVTLALPCLHAQGWAADGPATQCCDKSSMECRTGQNVGDKGSCPGSDVCVPF
ncbi:MAG TPA: hypothetical protein VKW76_06500 [Candidatus Binatia bacterium]|nr:hypothetical protein [Candidatus Binatia bacterium]